MKIKECMECKEKKIIHAKGLCKKCYNRMRGRKRYNECRCGNIKYERSRRCWKCYIGEVKGRLSRSMRFDKEKKEWVSRGKK